MQPTKKQTAAAALVVAIAAPMEGLRRVAYFDPPGVLTVCFGTTGKDAVRDRVYTIEECKALLNRDALKAVQQVDACVPDAPESVLVAFGDAAYNLGPKIACDTSQSTAARKLKAHDWRGACEELPRWDKAKLGGMLVSLPGLTKRRALEKQVCLEGLPNG